jgi:predicted nucleotidyltransferase
MNHLENLKILDQDNIQRLTAALMAEYGCHTAILYGSRARGDATASSDVDLLLVRAEGVELQEARVVEGIYLDVFIYSEASLVTPDVGLLRALGGVVLCERDGFGQALLAKLKALDDLGPAPMSAAARRVALVWSRKMLTRIVGQHGLEANYRRMQLLMQSVEDYFALRHMWFRGLKAASPWLLAHDPVMHQRLERAASPGADDAAFAALVEAVYGPFADEVKDAEPSDR